MCDFLFRIEKKSQEFYDLLIFATLMKEGEMTLQIINFTMDKRIHEH